MRKNTFTPLTMLLLVVMVLIAAAGFAEPSTQASTLPSSYAVPPLEDAASAEDLSDAMPSLEVPETETEPTEVETDTKEVRSEADPWKNFPNVCETFTAYQGTPKVDRRRGRKVTPVNYKRNRYAYPISDQRRTKDIIRLVAQEMGVAEPDFFVVMAGHESSFHPETIHILNEDLAANKKSWERHNYTAAREQQLRTRLEGSNAKKEEFWKVKSALSTLQTYKDNPHWNTKIEYDYVIPSRTLADGTTTSSQTVKMSKSVWAFGYGLYGHNAVLWTKSWSREAPPWVLCAHQGIVATIIEVWGARSATRECDELTTSNPAKYGSDGGSYLGVLRRLATGKCSDKPLRRQWQVLLAEYGDKNNAATRGGLVPWKRHADFGKKWPSSSNREEILAHMLRRAEEEGLLRPVPLQRKDSKDTTPVILAKK